jgi:hypothetical protein
MNYPVANDDRPAYRALKIRGLTQEEKITFNMLGKGAIWIAGPLQGDMPRRWGDNRGAWPVKISITEHWAMSKRDKLEGVDVLPYVDMDFIWRWWFDSIDMADRVRCELLNDLREREIEEGAKGNWYSFDPSFGLEQIDAEIHRIAIEKKLEILTDRQLLRSISWQLSLARRMADAHA